MTPPIDWNTLGGGIGALLIWAIRYEMSQRSNRSERNRLHSENAETLEAQNAVLAQQTEILEKTTAKLDKIDGRLAQINGTMGRHDERITHVEREVDRLRGIIK